MKSLKGTKTAENLMKSFAGEGQANMRYTFFASVAKKEGYVQISNIFLETAGNEVQHAKRFYKFLKEDFPNDEEIEITSAKYPVSLHGDTKANLKAAAMGEHEEYSDLYLHFAEVARKEGFDQIATVFERVADVEKHHEARYKKLLANLENGEVFKKKEAVLWKCGNCGYIFAGEQAPEKCPACAHPQAYFELLAENY